MYAYIVRRAEAGASPTVREISAELGVASTSTVHSDLRALAKAGRIEMAEGLNRSIRLPGAPAVRVPLVGTVAAGTPILAVQNIERYIPVGIENARDRELFALRVRGDSMIKAAILDGDIVIVEQTETADNGRIVVALVDDEATVKRFFREESHEGPVVRLQPENDNLKPIILNDVTILGRVIGVQRYYYMGV
jgi:repressor LexA